MNKKGKVKSKTSMTGKTFDDEVNEYSSVIEKENLNLKIVENFFRKTYLKSQLREKYTSLPKDTDTVYFAARINGDSHKESLIAISNNIRMTTLKMLDLARIEIGKKLDKTAKKYNEHLKKNEKRLSVIYKEQNSHQIEIEREKFTKYFINLIDVHNIKYIASENFKQNIENYISGLEGLILLTIKMETRVDEWNKHEHDNLKLYLQWAALIVATIAFTLNIFLTIVNIVDQKLHCRSNFKNHKYIYCYFKKE